MDLQVDYGSAFKMVTPKSKGIYLNCLWKTVLEYNIIKWLIRIN